MVVGKEKIVDLGRAQTGLDQLLRGGRSAVEHQVLTVDLDDVGGAKAVRRWGWRAGPQDNDTCHQHLQTRPDLRSIGDGASVSPCRACPIECSSSSDQRGGKSVTGYLRLSLDWT